MIQEIRAKTLLIACKDPDSWFGVRYRFNIYRGCQHQCIYCDSRSECYGIENFADIQVKVNAIELLEHELARKRQVALIGTGAMSDPYTPAESLYNLTGRSLQVLARRHFGVHIMTKSDLVLRDVEILSEIARLYCSVAFSIDTTDDVLALKLEPGASLPSARFRAMEILAKRGIRTGVALMPVLPYLEDNETNVIAIVRRAAESGASFLLPWFGLSMRAGQREYFYLKLDELFPGLRQKYQQRYGLRYDCPSPDAARLTQVCRDECRRLGLICSMKEWVKTIRFGQLSLY